MTGAKSVLIAGTWLIQQMSALSAIYPETSDTERWPRLYRLIIYRSTGMYREFMTIFHSAKRYY